MNELGLRGPVLPVAKPDGHYRILYVGDSTCWGLKVPLEESFAHRATERIGADHPDTVFEYMIGAVPGYSSYHSTVIVKRLLPRKPDLVVFYVGARNDHSRANRRRDILGFFGIWIDRYRLSSLPKRDPTYGWARLPRSWDARPNGSRSS